MIQFGKYKLQDMKLNVYVLAMPHTPVTVWQIPHQRAPRRVRTRTRPSCTVPCAPLSSGSWATTPTAATPTLRCLGPHCCPILRIFFESQTTSILRIRFWEIKFENPKKRPTMLRKKKHSEPHCCPKNFRRPMRRLWNHCGIRVQHNFWNFGSFDRMANDRGNGLNVAVRKVASHCVESSIAWEQPHLRICGCAEFSFAGHSSPLGLEYWRKKIQSECTSSQRRRSNLS